jgi:ribose transport system permease protein
VTQGAGNVLTQLGYRYFPDHLIGEVLTKRWLDNAIPFLVLLDSEPPGLQIG